MKTRQAIIINNLQNDLVDLNEANRCLRVTVLPDLVSMLDSLSIMPIDSESLKVTFHRQAVNIRYLGAVAMISIVPHIKNLCFT